MQIVDIYRAKIVDVAQDSIIVEVTGAEDKIASLFELVKRFGVREMVRTGRVVMTRGAIAKVAGVEQIDELRRRIDALEFEDLA